MDKRLLCGVGINDANYRLQKKKMVVREGQKTWKVVWICPFYNKWQNMINRCYNKKILSSKKGSTYIGCTVCEEWLTFSNFKSWMETQDWEDKCLDKDLLIRGNKLYSPDTCVFVSKTVNSFITERNFSRGAWPIGVHFQHNKFAARCDNPFTNKKEHLGMFHSPNDAHMAWVSRKLQLAEALAKEITDVKIAEALVSRYENYKENV